MTYKQYYEAVSEIPNYTVRDAFTSDVTLSITSQEDADKDIDLVAIADQIGMIWDAYHMSVKELRATTGLSQAAFADRFLVPRRTVESWESTSSSGRECPFYTRMMIADLLGLLPERTED